MAHHPDPFINAAIVSLERNRDWAEQAIAQTSDADMHRALRDGTNSIAVIMKHVAGNLRSRWTDFLTTDGEKEWRHRDDEFVDDFASREELMAYWESGWACVLGSLRGLEPADLARTVTIRGEPHSVPLAIQRSVAHTCYHIGQIILIARALHDGDGDDWKTITIPRGGSAHYNENVWGKGHYGRMPSS